MTIKAGSPAALRLERVLENVYTERERQEERFQGHTLASSQMTGVERLAIIAEEFGEVAHDVSDLTWPRVDRPVQVAHLRTELVQLAACCVAWVEGIDEQSGAAGF